MLHIKKKDVYYNVINYGYRTCGRKGIYRLRWFIPAYNYGFEGNFIMRNFFFYFFSFSIYNKFMYYVYLM